MFPRLYSSSETSFTNNGLGILSGCLWCECEQKSDSSYELQFEYPTEGEEAVHWQEIARRSMILCRPTPKDSMQAFRVYNIQKKMNGNISVKAAHWSYDLSDYLVQPFDAYSAVTAMTKLAQNALTPTGFTFWTDITGVNGEVHIKKPMSVRAALAKIQDAFGGEFEWDNRTVRLYANRGVDRGVTIAYGKNLTDFKQEEEFDKMYTGILPYWVDPETGDVMELTNPVVNVDGVFDFQRILPYDFSSHYDEKPTEQQLRNSAEYHIQKYRIWEPQVSMDVKFEQLEQMDEYKNISLLERVSLYDTVTVKFPKFGGISVKARAVDVLCDVLNDRIERVTLGQYRKDITDTIADTDKMVDDKISAVTSATASMIQNVYSALDDAVEEATEWISSGDGYVVIKRNGSGQAIELLVMDTPNISTAVNVWRWNVNGLGFSSNGYAGPYTTAITQNGSLVADFITTGTLSANLIQAGAITSVDGDLIFDVDNSFIKAFYDSDHYMQMGIDGITFHGPSPIDQTDAVLGGLEFFAQGTSELHVGLTTENIWGTYSDPNNSIWQNTYYLGTGLYGGEINIQSIGSQATAYGEFSIDSDTSKIEVGKLVLNEDNGTQISSGTIYGIYHGTMQISQTFQTVTFAPAGKECWNTPIVFADYSTSAQTIGTGDYPSIKIRRVDKTSFQIGYGGSGSATYPVTWVVLDIA